MRHRPTPPFPQNCRGNRCLQGTGSAIAGEGPCSGSRLGPWKMAAHLGLDWARALQLGKEILGTTRSCAEAYCTLEDLRRCKHTCYSCGGRLCAAFGTRSVWHCVTLLWRSSLFLVVCVRAKRALVCELWTLLVCANNITLLGRHSLLTLSFSPASSRLKPGHPPRAHSCVALTAWKRTFA